MKQQKSFVNEHDGVLYLVPTPIGNLEDMSFRAIRILKESSIIAAEDTRNTKKLCNYFEIETPITSYHEHNKEASGKKIISRLEAGEQVALVSDAGMPSISDPGYEIVKEALAYGYPVIPLPGPNAALTALIASGVAPQPFYFYGFLSRGKKERRQEIEKLKTISCSIILYESPHRLKDTLSDLVTGLDNRNMVLSRELTKKFEEFVRGTTEEILEWANSNEIRGEFCLIIEGASDVHVVEESKWWESLSILEHVQQLMEEKELSSKEAIKEVAKERNLPKRDVYQAYHIEQ